MWWSLLACAVQTAPPSPSPVVVDRAAAEMDLGAPAGVDRVDVVSFLARADGSWALAGAVTTPAGFERWVGQVDADGAVTHLRLGPGRVVDADVAPDGTLWLVGFAGDGAPWFSALRPGGGAVEGRPAAGVGSELWAVRATETGAHLLGLFVPPILGQGDPWWLEVDPRGATVAEQRGGGLGYGYAWELDVGEEGAIAVGSRSHKGRTWTRGDGRLREAPLALEALDPRQVRRSADGWVMAGAFGLDPRVRFGQVALVRVPDAGAPEVLAKTDEPGPPGEATSLWLRGHEAWLHTVRIADDRWAPLGHQVFRREGSALVPVGARRGGWGAVLVQPDGAVWRAWWEDGAVRAERLGPRRRLRPQRIDQGGADAGGPSAITGSSTSTGTRGFAGSGNCSGVPQHHSSPSLTAQAWCDDSERLEAFSGDPSARTMGRVFPASASPARRPVCPSLPCPRQRTASSGSVKHKAPPAADTRRTGPRSIGGRGSTPATRSPSLTSPARNRTWPQIQR